MAASDHRQTEAVQSRADEKWVFLQDGGDAAKELLLEEQDGGARGGKEFLRWCRSAFNDVLIRNDFLDDMRPYVLGIALFVNTVLRLLAAFASLAECEILHAMLTSLGNFTMAVLCPAVFFYTARFLSLLAAKASVVKTAEVNFLLFCLLVTNAVIIVAACCGCIYEVGAGFTASSKAGRQAWYLLLPVIVLRGHALMAVTALAPPLVVPMKTDLVATFHTFALHWRETKEARKLFTKRWLHPLKPALLTAFVIVICYIALIALFMFVYLLAALPKPTRPAASRGI